MTMKKDSNYRVITRRFSKGPNVWGVQMRSGFTDGKQSWRLATSQPFYRRIAAEQWIAEQEKSRRAVAE